MLVDLLEKGICFAAFDILLHSFFVEGVVGELVGVGGWAGFQGDWLVYFHDERIHEGWRLGLFCFFVIEF